MKNVRLKMAEEYEVLSVNFHRNGVGGVPFWVVIFRYGEDLLTGIVFQATELSHVAVINPSDEEEKYRGDHFDAPLRKVIAEWQEAHP